MSWKAWLRPSLKELKAYEPEPQEGDAALDANESPYGPPAEFLKGLEGMLSGLPLNRYPDPACHALLEAAASSYGLPQGSLLPGNGSDELIALLLTAFGGDKRSCLVASPSFSMYALCAKAAGWQVLEEELGPSFGLTEAFVRRAERDKPALIFLASPNNPSGNAMDPELVEGLLGLPSLLVLDEAYAEFCEERSRLREAPMRENLVVLRTLSKGFGLAGLRVGFLAGPKALVGELNKARLPYNIDILAQALATRAFSMKAAFAEARAKILADKPRLEAGLRALPGAEVFPSDANFFLFRHPAAPALHAQLLKKGLRLRRFRGGRLDNCLRISVGSPSEVDRALAAFKDWKP